MAIAERPVEAMSEMPQSAGTCIRAFGSFSSFTIAPLREQQGSTKSPEHGARFAPGSTWKVRADFDGIPHNVPREVFVVIGKCDSDETQEPTEERSLSRKHFIDTIYCLDSKGASRRAVGRVISHLDELLRRGDFQECNLIFELVDPSRLSDTLIVSFLAITAAATPRLKSRAIFYKRAYDVVLARRGRDDATDLLDRFR